MLNGEINDLLNMARQKGTEKMVPVKHIDMRDNITFKEGDEVVTPDKAKQAIMEFLINEVGSFIETGFIEERINITKRVDDEITALKKFVNNKIDKAIEEVVKDLKSSKLKEEINKGIEIKLNKIKENL